MVNKCCIFGCKSGYLTTEEKVSSFHFPLENKDLNGKWIFFVNRRDWVPTVHTVICVHHLEEKYIQTCGKRKMLRWDLKPIPSIHTSKELERPSVLPTISPCQKSPVKRIFRNDEIDKFIAADKISNFGDLTESCAPTDYKFYKRDDEFVIYYLLEIEEFPRIRYSIKIDCQLHIKLQCDGYNVPLPLWFTSRGPFWIASVLCRISHHI